MRGGILGLAAAAALALSATGASAAVTIGVEDSNNTTPFVDGSIFNMYQQVYAASAFSGPTVIEAVSFYEAMGRSATTVGGGVYTVNFYLTSKAIGGLSSDMAANRGTLLASFGAFDPPSAIPDVLTLDGADFTYDPSKGNLLMQVLVTGASSGVGTLAADSDSSATSRAYYSSEFGFGGADSFGLVTTFTTSAVQGVPEPATWALMLAGFGAVGAALRRRRFAAVA